jgi:hypothetical protein
VLASARATAIMIPRVMRKADCGVVRDQNSHHVSANASFSTNMDSQHATQ